MAVNKPTKFVLFTEESLAKIAKRIEDEKLQEDEVPTDDGSKLTATQAGNKAAQMFTTVLNEKRQVRVKQRPNPALIAGKQFPDMLGTFPAEMYGKPIEDLDEYYSNKYVSICSFYTVMVSHLGETKKPD
jgi:hypothetical protein